MFFFFSDERAPFRASSQQVPFAIKYKHAISEVMFNLFLPHLLYIVRFTVYLVVSR